MLIIRAATSDDVAEIFMIEQATDPCPWSKNLIISSINNPQQRFMCLENKQLIVGYIVLLDNGEELEILKLAISPAQQRQGYASQLLHYTLDYAQQSAKSALFLEVRASNQAAIKLYQKFNFQQTGLRKNYYQLDNQQKEDALLYQYHFKC